MSDKTLIAVSDVLVLTALQRAYSRCITRATKPVPLRERHRAYEHIAIPEQKIEQALADAWALCPLLASKYLDDVDALKWSTTLDTYTRSLLMSSMPHTRQRLEAILDTVPLGFDQIDDEDEVTPTHAVAL